jgi:hypothetical protein
MKHVSQFLLVSSLSLIAFSGQSSLLASSSNDLNNELNDETVVNVPARPQKIAAPSERANRKPAVEARVYVEDPSHPSNSAGALYYYDYKDQRPEQGQNPPLQPSTF